MQAPPATDDDLRAVEEAHGVTLPADLMSLWRGANGPGPGSMNYNVIVPPGLMLMSTRYAIQHLREIQALTDADDATVAGLMCRPAGSPDDTPDGLLVHLPAWILFAQERDGYFVDCRPGELHGCVMKQGAYGGWGGPLWPSVAALWAETADVLTAIGPHDEPDHLPTSAGDWRIPSAWWHPA